ncbi:MAG: threonine ammonia-lyase, partial [Chloroflexota bacterium]
MRRAAAILAPYVHRTPLLRSDALSNATGYDVWLKAENLQRTGSFKVRGALARVSQLAPEERQRGILAASAGNHAQGVAFAARQYGVACTIVMPENAPLTKL